MKNKRKRSSAFLLAVLAQLHIGCSDSGVDPGGDTRTEKGYVTGVVKDGAGKALPGVRIIVDNSIFFNSNITTYTNGEGKYKVKVPNGSWYAFASHSVSYNGENYSFYLHPDNPGGFGGEGGERNFVWRLTGAAPQPLSGHYGGLVTIDNFPGVYIDPGEIDFVLTPQGALVDGSEGSVIRRRADDSYQLADIPVGRYRLRASYQGKPVKFRRWNSDEDFREEYDLGFKSQIAAQCDNCAKLEYYWQP